MARAVYSTRFISLVTSSAASESYTVPAGYTAVIRDINGVMWPEASTTAYVEISDTGLLLVYWTAPTDTYENFRWQGRQVIDSDETISAVSNSPGPVYIAVSGYLLSAS